jgi:hypothetical protein
MYVYSVFKFFQHIYLANTPSVSQYLSPLTVVYNFDHSSYSKHYASTVYFVFYIFIIVGILNLTYLFT